MQTYREIRTENYTGQPTQPTVLTIGNFDGIHRGHQALLREVQRVAGELAAATGIITFDPHPLAVLRPDQPHTLLTTPWERLQLAAALGIDIGVVQPFTPEIAALAPETFMRWLKQYLNLAALVVGPDFALGRNRAGNVEVLTALGQTLGYTLHIMEPVDWQGKQVRSSAIRNLLAQGDVGEAADLLGRPYHATGLVVHGDQRGRQIGIPTANMQLPADKLWPADGVYATRTYVHASNSTPGRHFNSATNLGMRPTVDGTQHRFETHLLDFPLPGHNDDLYGRNLTVEFVARLRGEQRFNGLDELVAQIRRDIEQARSLLAQPHPTVLPFSRQPS